MPNFNRRNFLTALPAISLARAVPFSDDIPSKKANRFRLSLNAYSFNDMLMKKKMEMNMKNINIKQNDTIPIINLICSKSFAYVDNNLKVICDQGVGFIIL